MAGHPAEREAILSLLGRNLNQVIQC